MASKNNTHESSIWITRFVWLVVGVAVCYPFAHKLGQKDESIKESGIANQQLVQINEIQGELLANRPTGRNAIIKFLREYD